MKNNRSQGGALTVTPGPDTALIKFPDGSRVFAGTDQQSQCLKDYGSLLEQVLSKQVPPSFKRSQSYPLGIGSQDVASSSSLLSSQLNVSTDNLRSDFSPRAVSESLCPKKKMYNRRLSSEPAEQLTIDPANSIQESSSARLSCSDKSNPSKRSCDLPVAEYVGTMGKSQLSRDVALKASASLGEVSGREQVVSGIGLIMRAEAMLNSLESKKSPAASSLPVLAQGSGGGDSDEGDGMLVICEPSETRYSPISSPEQEIKK